MDHIDAQRYETLVKQRGEEAAIDVDTDIFALTFNLVRAANLLVSTLDQSVYRSHGVSYAGFRIMFALWAVGTIEPNRLAVLASVTRSSTSSVLNTLERDGLAERRRESADRRVVTVQLTDRGKKLVLETFEEHHAIEREWVSALTKREQSQVVKALRKLVVGSHRVREE